MKHTASLVAALISLSTLACGPSLEAMHERARVGTLQNDAPLRAKREVLIQAPRAVVWSLLTDVATWPSWQPTVTAVTAPAVLEPGARFTWVNGGSTISSQLALVEPSARLAWTGSVATAKAIHVWRLDEPTPGTTRVEVEESMDGMLLTWFYGQHDLEAEMDRSLGNLRRAAEARTALAAR